jgi:hypothetical protein
MWLLFKEEFEDTKGVIRIHISKKKRQRNGQKKKDKQRSINHTHKCANKIYVLLFTFNFWRVGYIIACKKKASNLIEKI